MVYFSFHSKSMYEIFTEEEKRAIAGKARTLHERIQNIESLEATEEGDSEIGDLFQEWKNHFSGEDAFARRLEQDGLSTETCRHALRNDKLSTGEPIPAWVSELEALIAKVQDQTPECVSETPNSNRDCCRDKTADEWIFDDMTAAISGYAYDQLNLEHVGDDLSEEAVGAMVHWFRDRFEARFWRVPFAEFKGNISTHDPDLSAAKPDDFEDLPTDYYDQFIDFLFAGGFETLCREYPMFSRLLVTQIRQWVDFVREFLDHLRADRERLANRFGIEGTVGSVIDIEPLNETTFGGGRTVMRVEFECGLVLAYKPRSVEAGGAFYRVLDRLDKHLPTPDFETPTYLEGDEHGWMEWVESDECDSETAVERYYRRAGALICVAYFLDLTDCSFENLVSTGEQPLLVDVETALHPHIGADRKPIETALGPLRDDSVLSTLFLPCAFDGLYDESDLDRTPTEISGIGVTSEEATFGRTVEPVIEGINTDVMTVEEENKTIDRVGNIPKLDGTDQPPEEYVRQLTDGFERTYEAIVELRDQGVLCDEIGMVREFKSVETRLVYRSWYTSVLESLTARECLRDGARFGVTVEKLAAPFTDRQVTDPPWSIYDAERSALKRLEMPRFTCSTDSVEIQTSDCRIESKLDLSGVDRVRERIESADRMDARRQVELIRGCFGKIPTPELDSESSQTSDPPAQEATDPRRFSDERLRSEAIEQFERVWTAALEANDQTRHWTSIGPWAETQRLTLRPMDESLAAGRCGIALFAAGLYRVTGRNWYRRVARKALRPVRIRVQTNSNSLCFSNHGGAFGIGSIAYSLSILGELLDDEAILEDAVRTADFVTEASFRDEKNYGVFRGVAGTLLGLLAVYERTGAAVGRRAAVTCGEHLLNARMTADKGAFAWEGAGECSPGESGHHVGGIAYALFRLWDATGDHTYRDAAYEVLGRVDCLDGQLSSQTNRRYGTNGLGLWRLGMAEYVTDDRIEFEITRTTEEVRGDRLLVTDDLWSGNAGRVEFLLEAERRRELPLGARDLLDKMLARKERKGGYYTAAKTTAVVEPTFFYGISGIGYTALRAVSPESLPCVPLWE